MRESVCEKDSVCVPEKVSVRSVYVRENVC